MEMGVITGRQLGGGDELDVQVSELEREQSGPGGGGRGRDGRHVRGQLPRQERVGRVAVSLRRHLPRLRPRHRHCGPRLPRDQVTADCCLILQVG